MSQDTNPSPKPDDIVQAAKQIVQAAKQEKLEQPHIHYAHPSEVTADPELSKDDKLHALENLEQDARQLADAAAEGIGGGVERRLEFQAA